MTSKNGIDQLSEMIQIESDIDLIKYKGNRYAGVMENSKKNLSRWLYCVLHAGNEKLYTKNFDMSGEKLDQKISNSVIDTKIIVKGVPVEDMIEIGGVRINKKPIGNEVQLSCLRPNLTPGFFMYVHSDSHNANQFRHYIAASDPDYAIKIWSAAVNNLAEKNIQFSAKILSNSGSYPRNDAIVFYSNEEVDLVQKELIEITRNDSGRITVSPLCEKIGSNLGRAEQPMTADGIRQSFGEHRCNAIADATQDVFTTGLEFRILLKQRFINANIDPNDISKELRK